MVYVDLAGPVALYEHEALCRALGAFLGHADAKIRPNDVLRPPRTLNHKGRARGGDSTPVEWLIRPTDVRWDAAALAAKLGVEMPGPEVEAPGKAKGRNTKAKAGNRPTVDPDSEVTEFDLSAF